MWHFVTPASEDNYRIVLFDYVGPGKSDPSLFDLQRYAALRGYTQDIRETLAEIALYLGGTL